MFCILISLSNTKAQGTRLRSHTQSMYVDKDSRQIHQHVRLKEAFAHMR